MLTYVYELSTGRFLCGGPCTPPYDPATQGVVQLDRHPNLKTDVFDAKAGIRSATVQEIASYQTARSDDEALAKFNGEKLTKAVAIYFAGKLNIPFATAREEILTILKGL